MDGDFILGAAALLEGSSFNPEALIKKLVSAYPEVSEARNHALDIAAMLF